MHSGLRTNFTQGGICHFNLDKAEGKLTPIEKSIVDDRKGFFGWLGLGGSVLEVMQNIIVHFYVLIIILK